jgi:asparagine synthase (glutamine-hydrolysing)
MRWSIESRVPFLTVDMAEFLLGLPEDYLISTEGETKHVFRAAMRGLVPRAILDRRDKIGFQTPEHAWLRRLDPEIRHWLDGIEAMPFLRPRRCRSLVRAVIDGREPFTAQAWRLINFCRWVQLADPSL